MDDKTAIEGLKAIRPEVHAEWGRQTVDHAIQAIETLAKVRRWSQQHDCFSSPARHMGELYDLLEQKP